MKKRKFYSLSDSEVQSKGNHTLYSFCKNCFNTFKKITVLSLVAFFIISCQPQDQSSNRAFIVNKIKSASKLATVEFVVKKIVFAVKQKDGFIFLKYLPKATMMAHTEAAIKAGIDFNKLEQESIKINGKCISITLPPVEVINFSYPAEKFTIENTHTQRVNFFNEISIRDIDSIYRSAELNIKESCNYLNIAEVAENKTRLFLETILKKMGFTEIYIKFTESEVPLFVLPAKS